MNTQNSIPTCVGFILDGNRRWARAQNLPTIEGHKKGYEKLKETVTWCKDLGIQHVVAYVFSTENWNRSKEEVGYLLDLTRLVFKQEIENIRKENWSVRAIGDLSLYPKDLQETIQQVHDTNPQNPDFTVWLAASYGGRSEIVAGVNKLLGQGKAHVTEQEFSQTLWTGDMPDPELIIRTGGNKRLSNFLTWSSVYSELYFIDTFWPAFSKEDFQTILDEYTKEKRNFGV